MKNIIFIVGEEIRENSAFLNYIFRSYEEIFSHLDDLKFINNGDKNFTFLLENSIKKYSHITIFASPNSYHTISRILSTLTSDSLELKDETTLAPSLAQKVDTNSFLLSIDNCDINVIKATPLGTLPRILHNVLPSFVTFFLFECDDSQTFKHLQSLGITHGVEVSVSKFSKFLLLVKVDCDDKSDLDGFLRSIEKYFKYSLIKDTNLSAFIIDKLKENNATITFAESCTAGLCAARLGEISGASEVFNGSLVTYSNEIKNIWLNVDNEILSTFGAVSGECVSAMLHGALEISGASFALAISGIAGPTGATPNKPVGTVFIGAKEKDGDEIVQEFHILGDRNYVREESVNIAFSLLIKLRTDLFFK